MSDKKIVNSWNEWDPLKHVIVGRADGCCIPAPEPALDAKVPEDSDMKVLGDNWKSTDGLSVDYYGLLQNVGAFGAN